MKKKLRLLTIASIATKEKTIHYDHMQNVLGIDSIRELEDLIIEGTNNAVLKGKLDQKSKHFEVDYAMGRDIRKVRLSYDCPIILGACPSSSSVFLIFNLFVIFRKTLDKSAKHCNNGATIATPFWHVLILKWKEPIP